jgi:outer membrane protein assembly factor BamB
MRGSGYQVAVTTSWRLRSVRFRSPRIALLGLAVLVAAACASQGGAQLAANYPQSWSVYAGSPEHNAAFDLPAGAPSSLDSGVRWSFAEEGALPLDGPPKDVSVLGARGAPVKTTQFLGNSVGVTVYRGTVYVESDLGHLYALDAVTGKALWTATADNALMGNPVIADGVILVGSGDTGFSFEQVMAYAQKKPVVRGLGFSAIYGFDAATGKQLWRFATLGEAMPSLACLDHVCYEGTGDGHIYALEAKTGKLIWKTEVRGFASMSSANVSAGLVYVGFTNPNYIYALDAATGAVVWKQTVPRIANTGMGDNSPAVDTSKGIVIQNSVVDGDPQTKTTDSAVVAMNAKTGEIQWETKLGRGPSPPAYKAGVAMIHAGVVYIGSPNTSRFFALDEGSGKILWSLSIPDAGPAGAGRGSAVFYHGTVWLAAGPNLFAIDPKDGTVLGTHKPGGRFGIVNPVIVGGTLYVDNSWAWVQALPLDDIYPGWRSRH